MIAECELRSHFADNAMADNHHRPGGNHPMQITQQFDGGNIVVLAGSNADEICLEIRSDQSSEF
ncbi:MAG: hypothetical protein ACO2ZJ_01070 [Pseudohongiellaceae bacterium]